MPNGEQQYEYDVFISYSSHDQAWVRGELLTLIEQAGAKACIDFRDFPRGAWGVEAMTQAVQNSRKTLLILTESYIKSDWCKYERLILQTLSPTNADYRMLTLLKEECALPPNLEGLTHIVFTPEADKRLAWRQLFVALGRAPVAEAPTPPERTGWRLVHAYPMPPHFTGRVDEQRLLSAWLDGDAERPLLVLRALGGFGKSALVWNWLTHVVDPARWPKVVWWSFYEGEAGFERFLAAALAYLDGERVPERLSVLEVRRLVDRLRAGGVLLVLDGFERELRAFGGMDAAYRGDGAAAVGDPDRDCLSPLAERFLLDVAAQPGVRGKLVLTTRLCPRILEKHGGLLAGVREETLPELSPADAVAWFGAEGIRGTRAEIEAAGRPYGFHALSLRLLVGLILNDFRQPGDIAVAGRLDVSGDLVQCQHHVLEVAYNRLAPARRALLGRLACFRGPVRFEVLLAVAETESGESAVSVERRLEADLRDLMGRGLLHFDRKAARFDLHPIVRRYAYDRLAETDRIAAHERLRDYFADVPKSERVACLDDLAPLIELYHHMVRAGQFDEAWTVYRDQIWIALYYQLGAYHLQIDLLSLLFGDEAPLLTDEAHQAQALNELANSYSLSGQSRQAVLLFKQQIAIREKQNKKLELAIGLENMADDESKIGALRSAEAHLRCSIELCREISNVLWEAVGHHELGRLLAYQGRQDESAQALLTALAMFKKQSHAQGEGVTWAYQALGALIRQRSEFAAGFLATALDSIHRSLELADEDARARYPHERDYVRVHWLLGAAHRVAGDVDEAKSHLLEALERCRRINLVEFEADILIDLARLHAATGHPAEALRLAEEARHIAERCGYVLQGADAHLELAKLHLATDRTAARHHAEEAKRLATCDGPPDYTYHAAYQEALGLLEKL